MKTLIEKRNKLQKLLELLKEENKLLKELLKDQDKNS